MVGQTAKKFIQTNPMRAAMAVLLVTVAFAGCKSGTGPGTVYLAPRINGRVLDATTRQPLAGVAVQPIVPHQARDAGSLPKGAELLESPRAARTNQAGEFSLPSVRDLALFGRGGWYTVTIAFEHSRYLRFQTNYSLANVSSNAPPGEPVIEAGDILLQRIRK